MRFRLEGPELTIPASDGTARRLADIAGPRGTLIMFICNHCPYVPAVLDRILRDARELQELGIGIAAICSNHAKVCPEDSFENMRRMAGTHGFAFPHLHDEEQSVARAWGAACTPDFFGFYADLELRYRGRLDPCPRAPAPPGTRRELSEAMRRIAATGRGPAGQIAAIGCSIKWKESA